MTEVLSAQNSGKFISDWNETAHQIMLKSSPRGTFDMAYFHIAIFDAVNSIDKKYTRFAVEAPNAVTEASKLNAVSAAARRVLLTLYPADSLFIDSVYQSRIDILSSPESLAGLFIGDTTAKLFMKWRENDNKNATATYQWKQPGLGVYQTTPPGSPEYQPIGIINPKLQPFSFRSPFSFRLPKLPDYNSERYAEDFNEVKKYGSLDSSFTTPEQREIARFHTENPGIQGPRNIRRIVDAQQLSLEDAVRLYAQIYTTLSDVTIAGFESKYHFNSWRPITAIRQADIDGNSATEQDTLWQPLCPTPRHPEYPAAHGCGSAAIMYTLENFFGTTQISFSVTSNVTGTTHNFTSTRDYLEEITNARVWGGMHFRNSTEQGVEMGRKIAQWVADNKFQEIKTPKGQWQVQKSPLPGDVNPTLSFSAVDSNVCWGINEQFPGFLSPKVVLTTNGGADWEEIDVTAGEGLYGQSIFALNEQTAWIVLRDPSGGKKGGVFNTTNAGKDWIKQETAFPDGGSAREVFFFNADNGIATGDPRGGYWEFYTTSNGGDNWTRVESINLPAPGFSDWVLPDASYGNTYFVNTFSRSILKTTDFGHSWTVSRYPTGPGGVGVGCAFKDSLNGLAASYFGERSNKAARTIDGGKSWILINPPMQIPSIYFLNYVNESDGFYITTSHNNIGAPEPTTPGSMYTMDNGETWIKIDDRPHGPTSFTKSGVGWNGGAYDTIYKWNSKLTDVENTEEIVKDYRLEQNFPNPFNPSTSISYSIPTNEFVNLAVFDILGREVKTLVNEQKNAGKYKIQFNASNLATGVYIYRIKAGQFEQTRKLILIK